MTNAWGTLQSAFLAALDVILPEKERAARIRKKALSDFQLCPTEHSLLGSKITTLLDYKNPLVSDLLRALKYEQSGKAADLCASALSDYLREEIAQLKQFSPREVMLVPVPLHASRERERGFNQIEKVLERLPREFSDGTLCRISDSLLTRTRATEQQARLSRPDRLKNVLGAFASSERYLSHAHIILIDDVTTTGATLVCAGRPLREAGGRVSLLSLARA